MPGEIKLRRWWGLGGDDVSWTAIDASRTRAQLPVPGETAMVDLTVTDGGRLRQVALSRWRNPDGGRFRSLRFRVTVDDASYR